MDKQDYEKIASLLLYGAQYRFGIHLPKMDTPRNGRDEIWKGIYEAMRELGVNTDYIGDHPVVTPELENHLNELRDKFGNGLTMQNSKGRAYFLYQGVWQRDKYNRLGISPVISLDMMQVLEWTPTNVNVKKNPKRAVAVWKRAMEANMCDCRNRKELRQLLIERAKSLGMELMESETHIKLFDDVTGESELYNTETFEFVEYQEPKVL